MVNVPQSPMLELRESMRPGANWNGGRNACAYALRSARFAVGRRGHLQQQPAPSQTDIRMEQGRAIAAQESASSRALASFLPRPRKLASLGSWVFLGTDLPCSQWYIDCPLTPVSLPKSAAESPSFARNDWRPFELKRTRKGSWSRCVVAMGGLAPSSATSRRPRSGRSRRELRRRRLPVRQGALSG